MDENFKNIVHKIFHAWHMTMLVFSVCLNGQLWNAAQLYEHM
jgi:hypothetical protein